MRFPRNVETFNDGEIRPLECNTAGSNPMATNITITLRRPGEDIVTVGTTADAKILEFSITGNLSQNGSVYNCTAVNEIGPTSMSFTLVVRGELILTHKFQSFSLLPLSLPQMYQAK